MSNSKKISPYILIAGVVIALLSLIFDKGASNMKERLFIALAAFSGTVTMCSSFAVMLIVNVPLARATKKVFAVFSGNAWIFFC